MLIHGGRGGQEFMRVVDGRRSGRPDPGAYMGRFEGRNIRLAPPARPGLAPGLQSCFRQLWGALEHWQKRWQIYYPIKAPALLALIWWEQELAERAQ